MNSEPRWIPSGDFQPLRYRPGGVGNWSGHLPFAFDLVGAVRPQLLVELGTHYGESYFGFCQSIVQHNCSCACYAVDTWLGEEQSGFYDESVHEDVQAYNAANYARFSYLLRTTFDEAIDAFSENSIDILHIDGLHTYNAVSHDFQNWLPKVKAGGIVLLHDVVARHADFGVWKLWEELAPLGQRFLFTHSWGLGVFRKPLSVGAAPDLVSSLFTDDAAYETHLKRFYSLCALKLECGTYSTNNSTAAGGAKQVEAQVFPMIENCYSINRHASASFQPQQWQKIRFELPFGVGEGPLRIDLAQEACILDVAEISLRKTVRGEVVWSAAGREIAKLLPAGDLSILEERDFCRFISTGNDPQLFLTGIDVDSFDFPLELECWVRAIVDPAYLVTELKAKRPTPADENAQNSEETAQNGEETTRKNEETANILKKLKEEQAMFIAKQEAAGIELDLLQLSYRKVQGELYVTKTDLQTARNEAKAARAELDELVHARNSDAQDAIDQLVHARNVEAEKCRSLETTLETILRSKSWRITAPVRRLLGSG